MMPIVFVGLGAGAASALLLASMASRSPLSLFLVLIAPLPIMIAAVGWNHWTGLFAAIMAALGLAAAFGEPVWILTFLIGTGLPGWWLGYLALLGRADAGGVMEWYPPGRLVLWCAIIAGAIVLVLISNVKLDEAQFQAALKMALDRVAREYGTAAPDMSKIDVKRASELIAGFIPPATAALGTLTMSLNLYLAARIAGISGRLRRPWPNLAALRFPPITPAIFAIALVFWFMSGVPGIVGGVVSGALVMAYAMVGFAVLHEITRSLTLRPFLLAAAYFVTIAAVWPILFMTMLGVADSIFNFRKNAGGASQPPAPTQ
jgi:hypothetical protein